MNFKASSTSDLTMTHNVSDAPDPIDIKRKLLNVSDSREFGLSLPFLYKEQIAISLVNPRKVNSKED